MNHLDGNKNNNSASNLEWVTAKQNHTHAARMGLRATGERHGMSRITDAQARQILNDYPQKNQYELASEYGVSQVAVSYTLNRRVDEKKKAAAERNKFSGK